MRKIFFRLLILLLVLFAVPTVSFYSWIKLTPYSATNLPELKDGDLVFQTISASQSLAIIFATGSSYTHIGMIKIGDDSVPIVVEAVGPVREVPLEDWVKQGVGKRITLGRIRDLSDNDANAALRAAREYYGKPYDFYFLSGDDKIYCSELIYKSFAQGSDIKLGKEQSVGELNVKNFAVKDLIKQRWKSYPPCSGVKDFETCYETVMQQKLVSPASIAEDNKVQIIYSNYGVFQ